MFEVKSGNTAVTGVQFGDEGKGQIVDALAEEHDLIVRYNGGANAGHTVIVNGEKHALHLIPSGILHEESINVVANGVVLDPVVILEEIDNLGKVSKVIIKGHLIKNPKIKKVKNLKEITPLEL